MNEADFWEAPLHLFNLRLKGWEEGKETERRQSWEQTRLIAYNAVAPHLKKGDQNLQKFLPFPWEKTAAAVTLPTTEADSLKRYKMKLMRHKLGKRALFNEQYEALMRQHYQPDWGPHPDELEGS